MTVMVHRRIRSTLERKKHTPEMTTRSEGMDLALVWSRKADLTLVVTGPGRTTMTMLGKTYTLKMTTRLGRDGSSVDVVEEGGFGTGGDEIGENGDQGTARR